MTPKGVGHRTARGASQPRGPCARRDGRCRRRPIPTLRLAQRRIPQTSSCWRRSLRGRGKRRARAHARRPAARGQRRGPDAAAARSADAQPAFSRRSAPVAIVHPIGSRVRCWAGLSAPGDRSPSHQTAHGAKARPELPHSGTMPGHAPGPDASSVSRRPGPGAARPGVVVSCARALLRTTGKPSWRSGQGAFHFNVVEIIHSPQGARACPGPANPLGDAGSHHAGGRPRERPGDPDS